MSTTKELEAGVELDAAIAQAMGWPLITNPASINRMHEAFEQGATNVLLRFNQWGGAYRYQKGSSQGIAWNPSTDISDAWEVVEHFRAEPHERCVILNASERGKWHCVIGASEDDEADHYVSSASTAPLAICRAALKTIGDDK